MSSDDGAAFDNYKWFRSAVATLPLHNRFRLHMLDIFDFINNSVIIVIVVAMVSLLSCSLSFSICDKVQLRPSLEW